MRIVGHAVVGALQGSMVAGTDWLLPVTCWALLGGGVFVGLSVSWWRTSRGVLPELAPGIVVQFGPLGSGHRVTPLCVPTGTSSGELREAISRHVGPHVAERYIAVSIDRDRGAIYASNDRDRIQNHVVGRFEVMSAGAFNERRAGGGKARHAPRRD